MQENEVTVIDLKWFGDHLPNCRKWWRDVRSLTVDELASFDVVIWLAGLSNDPQAAFSPIMNYVENAAIPAYLCWLAKRAGVRRFILGSTCSVYGYAADREHDETLAVAPQYPYGIAKLQAEQGCFPLVDEAFSVIALRKGTVGGYSPRMRFDLVTNAMFKDAVSKGTITVSNSAIWRPIVAIEDAVRAYMSAVEAPQHVSGVFNILSENSTVGKIAKTVKRMLKLSDKRGVKIVEQKQPDVRNYRVSGARAAAVLGFEPQCTIEDIIGELLSFEDKFTNYDDVMYYNIRRFQELYD